ncbi:MAG: glycerophosphoryl diester phosphodiesterase [Actinomycetota bacterium]|nr:glycerophosphoryl diester phosphodiesterase [Actinomycetota bacterium]
MDWNVFRFARSVGCRVMVDRPLVLGHRGASQARPENTLAAFAKAREFGADGVELDVRRSADDRLVVHHDPHVEGFGVIREFEFAALRAARPEIPTLDEALGACAGMVVNVEIKCLPWEPDADMSDHEVVRAVVDLLRAQSSVALSDIIVSSFDLGAVDACRAFATDITTGWLTSGQEVAAAVPVTAEHGHAWLNADRAAALRASPDEIAAAQKAGVRVNVWTVDEREEITSLAAAGVDAIITDVPDVALEVLQGPPRSERLKEGRR